MHHLPNTRLFRFIDEQLFKVTDKHATNAALFARCVYFSFFTYGYGLLTHLLVLLLLLSARSIINIAVMVSGIFVLVALGVYLAYRLHIIITELLMDSTLDKQDIDKYNNT